MTQYTGMTAFGAAPCGQLSGVRGRILGTSGSGSFDGEVRYRRGIGGKCRTGEFGGGTALDRW